MKAFASLVAAVVLLAPAAARADSIDFIGQTLQAQLYQPTLANPVGGPLTFVVGDGVEATLLRDRRNRDVLTLDVSAANVLVNFRRPLFIGSQPFSGFVLTDVNHTIAPITGVTVNLGATTLAPAPNAALFSFDADAVYVNLRGLSAVAGQTLSLDLTFANAAITPLPGPAVGGMALLGLLGVRRLLSRRGREANLILHSPRRG